VAEPYLHSFPPADEFFPLLCTGRLTLAEVYWYRQTAGQLDEHVRRRPALHAVPEEPALKVEDLPLRLHVAFE